MRPRRELLLRLAAVNLVILLLRITAPHFVAGIIVGERAAPIVGYMRSWSIEQIKDYVAARAWALEEIEPREGSCISPQLSLRLGK
jgi:hypothetical protein